MAWVTTKDGRHVDTDWFDKEKQIASNKAEADSKKETKDNLTIDTNDLLNKAYDKYADAAINMGGTITLKGSNLQLNIVDTAKPNMESSYTVRIGNKSKNKLLLHIAQCIHFHQAFVFQFSFFSLIAQL